MRAFGDGVTDPAALLDFLGTWGYPALFFLLLLTGVGSPIPEDLLLLIAGYLVFSGVFLYPTALAVCLAGVVGSDLILYGAGRRLGRRPPGTLEARVLSPRRLRRVTRWFDRLGPGVVFAARLVPGTRAIVFITAGWRGLSAARFLGLNVCGAALWVPLLLFLGQEAGEEIGNLQQAAARIQNGVIWILGLAAVLLIVWLIWGREESKL